MFSKLTVAFFCLSAVLPALASLAPYAPSTYSSGGNYATSNGYISTSDVLNPGHPTTDPYVPVTPTQDNTYPRPSNPSNGGSMINQCNTGSVRCCKTIHDFDGKDITQSIGGLVRRGVVPNGLTGANCSPMNIFEIGGNSWCALSFLTYIFECLN